MTRSRQAEILVTICIVAVYLFARSSGLTSSCLWFDEIFSVHAATHQWNLLIPFVAADLIHPPLFYVLLKVWISMGGESVIWLRSLPVLFSCLALIPFGLLLSELKVDRIARLLALLLFAVNGSLIKYSQEVRMYSLLMLLGLMSMWLTVRYVRTGKGTLMILFVNLLLVYSHYFGWLVVGSGLIYALFENRRMLRSMFFSLVAVLIAFAPWLIVVTRSAGNGSGLSQNIGWMQRPGIGSVFHYVLAVVEPFYFSASNAEAVSDYRVSIPILMIVVVSLSIFLIRWKNLDVNGRTILKAASIYAVVPLVVAFAVSWLSTNSVWGIRHLIITFPPLMLIAAVAVSKLTSHSWRTAAIVLLVLFTLYGAFNVIQKEETRYPWCAWEEFAKDLKAQDQSEDNTDVYVFEDLVGYHLWYALRDDEKIRIHVVKDVPNMLEDKAYFLPRGFDGVDILSESTSFTGDKFFVAFRNSVSSKTRSVVFELLEKQGFSSAQSVELEIGGEREYLVKFVRTNQAQAQ